MKHIFPINKDPETFASAMEEMNEYSNDHARIKVKKKTEELFLATVYIGGPNGKPCRNVRKAKFCIGNNQFKVQSRVGLLQIVEFLLLLFFFSFTITFVLMTIVAFLGGYAVEEGYMDPWWFAFLAILCVLLFFGIRTFWRDNVIYLYNILNQYVMEIFAKCPQDRIGVINGVEINFDNYVEEPENKEVQKRTSHMECRFYIVQIMIWLCIIVCLFMIRVGIGDGNLIFLIGFILEIPLIAYAVYLVKSDAKEGQKIIEQIKSQGHCYEAYVKAYDYILDGDYSYIELYYEFKDEQGGLHLCAGLYGPPIKSTKECKEGSEWLLGKQSMVWYYPGCKVINEDAKEWKK